MFHSKKQRKVASKKKTNKISKVKPAKGSSVKVLLQEEVDCLRHVSQCRLKAAWANIIKRYQDISAEETDVIDLATEEVVVDRGILQKDTIRYVGTLSNLDIQDDAVDDSVWHLCENDDDFKKRIPLRKNNKANDKTNDIIEVLLEASNESFECLETESNEFSCYEEDLKVIDKSFEDIADLEQQLVNTQAVTNIEEISDCVSYSEKESLEITDEQLDSVNAEVSSLQSTGSTSSPSNQRRLKVYSFDTFDSGHESESIDTDSEFYDSDNEKICAQQENLDYIQQETIIDLTRQEETIDFVQQEETIDLTQQYTVDFIQRETPNYYQVESIQKLPPIALTQEQQRHWLEPTSEDYTELSTWTGTYTGKYSLLK